MPVAEKDFGFVPDSKDFGFKPDFGFEPDPSDKPEPAVSIPWSATGLSPGAILSNLRQSAEKPVIEVPPALTTSPLLQAVAPKIAKPIGEEVANIASGLTSPAGLAIGAAAVAAPEVVVPALGAAAVPAMVSETANLGAQLGKGDTEEAIRSGVRFIADAAQVVGAVPMVRSMIPKGKPPIITEVADAGAPLTAEVLNQKLKETENAKQISETTQVHGDVQQSSRTPEGGKEMPPNASSEGVPSSGSREALPREEVVPVPESPETVRRQVELVADPESPKSAALLTPGEKAEVASGMAVAEVPGKGTVIVNPEKADPATVVKAVQEDRAGQHLGMSQEAKPPGEPMVVQTKDRAGTVIQDEVVKPSDVSKAVAAGEALTPGAVAEVKPAAQVIQERVTATLPEEFGRQLLAAIDDSVRRNFPTDVLRDEARTFILPRVLERARSYLEEHGSMEGFAAKTLVEQQAVSFRRAAGAEKRGGGQTLESLDRPIGESESTLEEVTPTEQRGPSTAAQEGDLSAKVVEAMQMLAPEEIRKVKEFLKTGQGRIDKELAGKLRDAFQKVGVTEADLEPSRGPGAASPSDVGSQKERKFSERFTETKEIQPATREALGNRFYDPRSNEETNWMVNYRIERQGVDSVYDQILSGDRDWTGEELVAGTINLVKRFNAQAKELDKAGKGPEANALRDKIVRLVEFTSEEYGTKYGRTIQAFRMWNYMTPEGMLRAYTKVVREARQKAQERGVPEKELPQPDAKVQREIQKRSEATQELPEGFQKDQATTDLLGYIAKQKGIKPWDIAMSWWYASILSSPVTQAVNFLGAFSNVLANAGVQATLHPTAIPEIFKGLYRGFAKGVPEASGVLKTGVSNKVGKLQTPGTLELLKDSDSRFLRALSTGRYVGRLMNAMDMLNFAAAKEMKSYLLADHIARNERLTGKALTERVESILFESEMSRKEAENQAISEGLTGVDLKRRTNEILDQKRFSPINDAAAEFALRATYNNEPYGVLGILARYLGGIGKELPGFKFIVPFVNIVSNVTNESFNYTPWGYKRYFFGAKESGKSWFDLANAPKGDLAYEQLAKATVGTLGMMAVAALAYKEAEKESPKFAVYASGPRDTKQRYQLQESGWKPYSIKIGDHYFPYLYTPFVVPFSVIGSFHDSLRFNKMEDKDAATRLAVAFSHIPATIFSQSFLSSLSGLFEALDSKGGVQDPKAWAKLAARTGSSFVVPNAVRFIDKAFDPEVTQADSIKEIFAREFPVARSQMKPIINALGEPVKKEGLDRVGMDRFWTTQKSDPVWEFIARKQAFISIPNKNTKILNRTMTPDEYYDYVQISGQRIKEVLKAQLPRLEQLNAEQLEKQMDAITRQQREAAKVIILRRAK